MRTGLNEWVAGWRSYRIWWLMALLHVACSDSLARSSEENIKISPPVATIEVANSSEMALIDQSVGFTLEELGVEVVEEGLTVQANGAVLPSQLVDDDGDGSADRLLFLVDLVGAERKQVKVLRGAPPNFLKRTHAEISVKDGGHWEGSKYVGGSFRNVSHVILPQQYTDHSGYIRYEGPGLETESIGYRVYLDWRNSFDIFGKKEPDLTLSQTGLDGYKSYHEMADWGADILKVGKSLGMGGFGYWNGESVERVSSVDQRSATVLTDGPIYSAFALDFTGWAFDDRKVDLRTHLSMMAGSPLVHVQLKASEDIDSLAVGLVDHGVELMTGDLDITGSAWSYMATFGKQSLFDDDLGLVLLFRKKDMRQQTRDNNNHVLVMRTRGGGLDYYFGAHWSGGEGGIKSRAELESWLKAQVHNLTAPPRLRLDTDLGAKRKPVEITADSALKMSVWAAESEQSRRGGDLSFGGFDAVRKRSSNWNYTTGLLMQAMDDVAVAAARPDLAALAEGVIASYISGDGAIHTYERADYNIDNINSGKMLLRLYQRTGAEKYKLSADLLADQLKHHPRTSEGAFWHKKRYPSQLWLDGVYMGMPFLAAYGIATDNEYLLEEAVREYKITHQRLRDPVSGLYFHAWDEAKVQDWANADTGLSRHFWGRGVGWYAMALVDILDFIPETRTDLRDPLIEIVNELAAALVAHQDASGVWYQVMNMPSASGNFREASASSMFVYFLARAVERRYLPDTYREAALEGYRGLLNEFVTIRTDGTLDVTNICAVGGLGSGRDGSFAYYMSEEVVSNDPKGLAPFIMAGVEVSKMLRRK